MVMSAVLEDLHLKALSLRSAYMPTQQTSMEIMKLMIFRPAIIQLHSISPEALQQVMALISRTELPPMLTLSLFVEISL